MTWRLVLGVVYMQRRSLLSMLPMMALFSRPASVPEWIAGPAVLLIAVGAGSTAQQSLAMRSIVILPFDTKELHRAAWLLSALFPMTLLTLARVLGGGWHTLFNDVPWMFHATSVRVVFEVLYFGLIGAWVVMIPEHHQSNLLQDPWFLRKRILLKLALLAAMGIVPFVVIPRLPAALGDVSPGLWVVATMILAVGLAPFVKPPIGYQRVSPPATAPAESSVRAAGPAQAVLVPSRFQGVWALVPGLATRAFFLALGMILFLIFAQSGKPVTTIWRPFDSSLPPLRFLTSIGILPMMLLGALPGLGNRFSVLKGMPLSSRRAALILGLATSATPIIFWLMLVVTHVAASWQLPGTLHLGLLLAFIGAASLVDALGVKSGSSMMKFALGAAVLLAFTYGWDNHRSVLTSLVDHWSVPCLGLVCLALGVAVNFHTLTRSHRSSRAYRFGQPTAQQGAR